MNRTKKLSGAEFKKKRKQRQKSDEKLRNCFKKWLVTNSVEKQIISEDTCIEVNDDSTDPIIDLSSDHHLELIEEEIFISQSQEEFCTTDSEPTRKDGNSQLSLLVLNQLIPVASEENFQHRDPATWPKITDKIRCFLIEHGPEQDRREFFPNTLFDFDNRMPHFSSKWYEKIHPNGEKFIRTWLQQQKRIFILFLLFCYF